MTKKTLNGEPIHKAAHMYAKECIEGKLSRREFLSRTTALGVTATAAYALMGAKVPAATGAQALDGTLRTEMVTRASGKNCSNKKR